MNFSNLARSRRENFQDRYFFTSCERNKYEHEVFFFEIFLLNLSGVNQRPCLEDSVKFAPLKGKRTPLIPEILLHGSLGSPASLPSCNPVKNEIVASTWRSNDPHVLADKVYDVFPALLFPSPILSLPAAFFYPPPRLRLSAI